MFTLFSITFGCYITEYAIFWNHHEGKIICSIWYMSTIYLIGDPIVHSIFAIKYWVLSMKVQEIIKEKQDKWLVVKFWTVITL